MQGPLRSTSPRHVGPYTTLARLGAGGMGEVFLARPDALVAPGAGDLVAVKVIRAEAAGDPLFRRRFAREARSASTVDAPGVARVVACDTDAAQPWIATEYVPGPTLAEAVAALGPLPADTVAALGVRAARALAAVHAAGALHRDVKPANLLLGPDGPKLIDFGVARPAGATPMTATGALVGTPGFMSPEHVAGGRHVVPASDVFCLASVLAFAASGAEPFGDGPVAAVLYRVLHAEAGLDPVPDALRAVLRRCLVPGPDDRPGADELADQLGALLPGPPDAADPAGPAAPLIARSREDAERLCASGQPLLPEPEPTPLPPGFVATVRDAPRDTPQAATPAYPSGGEAGPAAPSARRRRRPALIAAVAAGIVLGVAAGLLAARDTTPPDDAGARTPEARPDPRLAARAGVDIVGAADRSGPAAQSPGQRPAGWRPWQGRLSHAPLDCAADTHALVCQLTNGTYEAVSPVDGKQLWTEGTPHAEGLGLDEAAVNVDGRFEVPGATLAPQSRGGRTVIGDADALRLLDSASGKPRWKARTPHGKGMFTTRPVLTDSAVLAVVESGNDSAGPAATLAAFALTDGHLLWQQPLTAQPYAQISRQSRSVLAVRGHTAYANGDGERFVAVDLRDGKVLRRDADEPGNTVETTPARDLPSGMDRRTTRSLLIADHRLYVDHHRLVDQPLGFGAPARTMPVPGAPAERPSSDVDVSGSVVAEQARPPMVLALGGIAHIVYDQGALVSVELPR